MTVAGVFFFASAASVLVAETGPAILIFRGARGSIRLLSCACVLLLLRARSLPPVGRGVVSFQFLITRGLVGEQPPINERFSSFRRPT